MFGPLSPSTYSQPILDFATLISLSILVSYFGVGVGVTFWVGFGVVFVFGVVLEVAFEDVFGVVLEECFVGFGVVFGVLFDSLFDSSFSFASSDFDTFGSSPNSLSSVFSPAFPSADNPLRFWNALTASTVTEP